MKKGIKLNILRIPTAQGTIVCYIHGFSAEGERGRVFAEMNGQSVNAAGHNQKRTIVRAIAQLHQKLSMYQDFSQ